MPPPVYPAGSYPARVVADGASNYWRLNEASGTSAVDVIGGANGTISGGVTLNQAGALADGDRAMAFDAAGDYVSVPTSPAIGTGAFTIECWINSLQASPPTAPFIIENNGGANGAGFAILNAGSGLIGFKIANGVAAATAQLACAFDGTWRHIVGVLTRGAPDVLRVFVDGVASPPVSPAANGWNLTAPRPLLFGTYSGGEASADYRYTGSLDDVAIYPRALTAPEIAAHYALRTFSLTAWRGVPWWVQIQGDDALDSFNLWEPITPSNTVNLPRGVTGGIWVGGGGDVAAVMGDNTMPVVIAAVPAGSWLPLAAKRIQATGTTATALVALYEA